MALLLSWNKAYDTRLQIRWVHGKMSHIWYHSDGDDTKKLESYVTNFMFTFVSHKNIGLAVYFSHTYIESYILHGNI